MVPTNTNRQEKQPQNNDAIEKLNLETDSHTHLGKCLQTNHCQSFCPAGICFPLEAPWFSRAGKRSTERAASEQKQEVNHVR